VDTGVHLMMVLDMAARLGAPLAVRFACLCHDLGKGTTPPEQWPRHLGHEQRSVHLLQAVSQRWRVPADCRELAVIVAREHGNIHRSGEFGAEAVERLLARCDAWRQPARFAQVLQACECDARGRAGHEDDAYPQGRRLALALQAGLALDAGTVASQAQARGASGPDIGRAVARARAEAITRAI
jgi:tRNA nucleotidyltransferase (CCA-adding enzyme)